MNTLRPEGFTAGRPKAANRSAPVFIRYWGSHFKTQPQAENFAVQFQPLVERGWCAYLVLEEPPELFEWLHPLRDLGVRIHYLRRPHGNFDLRICRETFWLCKETRCTVFHCDNLHTSPLIGAALARVPVRVWQKRSMSAHFEDCRKPNWKERLALSTRLSGSLATRVVAVSRAVRDEIVSLGISSERVTVLSNPRPTPIRNIVIRKETRTHFGYVPSDIVLLTVGHSVPVKGWDILLKSFARLAMRDSRVRLLFVGSTSSMAETPLFVELRRFIAEQGLGTRVQFTGHLSNVGVPLVAADIFVLPSRSEGSCNALLEALEAGLPCVATNVGNAAELIDPEEGGFIVKRADVDDMAGKLLKLVQDDALRRSMAAASHIPEHVLTRKNHAEQLVCLYESMLARSA